VKHRLLIAVAVLCIGLGQCKSDDPSDTDGSVSGDRVTKTIGSSGGTITSNSGVFTLVVPAGALSSDVEVSIEEIDPATYPQKDSLFTSVAEIGPSGTSFAIPAMLSLTIGGVAPSGKKAIVARLDTGSWSELSGSTRDGGQVYGGQWVNGQQTMPIQKVKVVPATLMPQQPSETWWSKWETDSPQVTLSGETQPDGQGSWTSKNTGDSGTFQISGGKFSFSYHVGKSGNFPILASAAKSSYWLELYCKGGCNAPPIDMGVDKGVPDKGSPTDAVTPDVPKIVPIVPLWVKRFTNPINHYGRAVLVDSSNNVYVRGEGASQSGLVLGGSPLNGSRFLGKFDSTGKHLWSTSFDFKVRDMALDGSGNLLITGQQGNSTPANIGGGVTIPKGGFVARINGSTGTGMWGKSWQYADLYAVTADGGGNTIFTGSNGGPTDFGSGTPTPSSRTVVVKLKGANHVWTKEFQPHTEPDDLVTDGANNIYLAGTFVNPIDFGGGALTPQKQDVYLVKLSGANGQHVWSKKFGGTAVDWHARVTTDPTGNVIITAELASTGLFAKYDAAGNELWRKDVGLGPGAGVGTGVATDAAGNIYFSGAGTKGLVIQSVAVPNLGKEDALVAKFDSNGNVLWVKSFGNANWDDRATGIAVDSTGKAYVTGIVYADVDFGSGVTTQPKVAADPFLLKLP